MNTAHRERFEPSVRCALGLLDRVVEGLDVPRADVDLALQVTGDWPADGMHAMHGSREKRGNARANANRSYAGAWRGWHEGPAGSREPHPRAGGAA